MTPWVTRLLAANVGMFLVQRFPAVTPALWFVPAEVLSRPWTPFTYMFLHADFLHILFNMIGLYFFGPRLEARLGSRHFIFLYVVSGLVGAAVQGLSPRVPIVGASAAVFGVFLGYARYWPRDRVYIWGVLPIEAWLLVLILAALALKGGFGFGSRGTAHWAHLGGFAGGWLYLKWMEWRSPGRKFRAHAKPGHRKPGDADVERWTRINRDGLHPVNREEIDRVLAKLEAHGATALTPDERAFLDRFSAS